MPLSGKYGNSNYFTLDNTYSSMQLFGIRYALPILNDLICLERNKS